MEATARFCIVCKARPASKHRLRCNSCKNVHLNDIKRCCTDCQENLAAPGRKICWNCKLKRNAAAHPANVEKANKRRNNRYAINANNYRTKRLKKAKVYRDSHLGKTREDSRAWREKNPEWSRASQRAWRAKNPGRIKRNSQLYALLNPDKIRHNNRLRKARMRRANIGTITAALWNERVMYFGQCCAYCLQPMDVVTMEHVTPLTRGGLHDIGNVVPACVECNAKKYYKNLLEWLLYPDTRRFVGIGTPLPSTRRGRPRKVSVT
jgi:HNH endonuclease